MNYAERWRLAVATKQALPVPTETGDVMPAEPASSSSSVVIGSESGLQLSATNIRAAFENMARGARVLLAVGTGLGLILGGAIGYAVGKSKS
jgi:hypothetical protein